MGLKSGVYVFQCDNVSKYISLIIWRAADSPHVSLIIIIIK